MRSAGRTLLYLQPHPSAYQSCWRSLPPLKGFAYVVTKGQVDFSNRALGMMEEVFQLGNS